MNDLQGWWPTPVWGKPARRPRALPPNSILEQTEPTHQRLYSLMGEPLLVQTNDPALLDLADESFGRFGAAPDDERPPLILRLFVHDVKSTSPPGRPVVRTHGHLLYVAVGAENVATLDLLAGFGFGFITPEVVRDGYVARTNFLVTMALCMLDPARGFVPVHAACVVKDGLSVLLHAEAGVGKSTLAYACARRGYQILSDDVVHVRVRPEGVWLWGLPWKFQLLPDSVGFFPELVGIPPRQQMNGEWKLEVELEEQRPGSTTVDAAPGLVVFVERGGGPAFTRVEAVPLAQALDRFEVVWPWWVGWTEQLEAAVPRLLERGAYRLRMNGSPDDAVDALDDLLDAVWRGEA